MHRFAVFTAFSIFFLLVAGALVTSNGAGLSVPDWPTSFGSIYKIPPLVGGVQFEHVHRMIAQFIGLLTIALAVWTQRSDRRPWMRALGWSALGTVIAQGMLGGITVLFNLPPAVSTAHATLAQIFFCIVVCMALFTGRSWIEQEPSSTMRSDRPSLTALTTLSVSVVWVQLILGAALRHNGMKWLPHIVGAVIVTCVLGWTIGRVLSRYKELPVRKPATILMGLLMIQISLGLVAFMTRVMWGKDAAQPLITMVASTVSHVAVGALILATTIVLAVQARRYEAVSNEEIVTQNPKAVIA